MKAAVDTMIRSLRKLTRPSKEANARLLRSRGETASSLVIREAIATDIPDLARLHVVTWNATHGLRANGPSYALRERQWRDTFDHADGSWFCLVVERANGELVGFAKGQGYQGTGDLAEYTGELNKIYLRREYQRQGLGRRLVGQIVRRFLSDGIASIVLFGEAQNPACGFWEALGGDRLCAANGEFYGGYAWRDLHALLALCAPER
jgi:ribosomal protein S18 acetylase RimI-like enzyme